MDNSMNIWGNLQFNAPNERTVSSYLDNQLDFIKEATNGELFAELEVSDGVMEFEISKTVGLNRLFVVAPKLGNFRRQILTVAEGIYGGRYPVDIVCHVNEMRFANVTEDNLLAKLSEIVSSSEVQRSIVNLFNQSKQVT
jgi:hypothetical protein